MSSGDEDPAALPLFKIPHYVGDLKLFFKAPISETSHRNWPFQTIHMLLSLSLFGIPKKKQTHNTFKNSAPRILSPQISV